MQARAVICWSVGWSIPSRDPAESLDVFTRLTIGDGLVSQLPSFVISIAAALIVTRSSGRRDLGTELTSQLTSRSTALGITAVFLTLMAFTGLPAVPMLTLAAVVGGTGWFVRSDASRKRTSAEEAERAKAKAELPPVEHVLSVDTLELEVGYALVRYASFRVFEILMSVCIGVMFVTVVLTVFLMGPDWPAIGRGFIPSLPLGGSEGVEAGPLDPVGLSRLSASVHNGYRRCARHRLRLGGQRLLPAR